MAFTDFNSPDEVQKAYSITYADKNPAFVMMRILTTSTCTHHH